MIFAIALLAGLVVPQISAGEAGRREREFEPQLKTVLVRGLQEAHQAGHTVTLRYDSTSSAFILEQQADTDQGQPTELQRIAKPEGIDVKFWRLDDADVSQDEWKVSFYQDGTADVASLQWERSQKDIAIRIDHKGRITESEQLPDPASLRWQAGDLYEQR
ncbi:MAG: hypothetical protein JSS72_11555 [Armatimonadetes bacterium]|nr:hypothetical protein [Armatimonadota bacterium]